MTALPLEGLKVLDMSRVLAGPLTTMMLGDLGADVIKVERPGRGDDTRAWGPPFDDGGESAYYLSVNRNKCSVAADLGSPADRTLVMTLMREADVVVENFLPGTLARIGIDPQASLRDHPKLIWCTITGFGQGSSRPGYDFVVQGESGWMAITGAPDGEPVKTGVALADFIAGKDAAIAILAALAGRSRGAADRHLVVSLAQSARAALVNVAQNALVSGTEARRWGNAHANLVPYQLFQTADRPIILAVGNDDQWLACVGALGLKELEGDVELATNRGRLANRERLVGALQATLLQRPAREWLRVLGDVRVPCGVVKTVLEAIADAGDASAVMGMPPSVGGSRRLRPPRLDQHGDLIRRTGWRAFETARRG
jgi:crotonobetainyl-CoA:carnitine CoA-transferase CaiB-like acyl-CoA transferase